MAASPVTDAAAVAGGTLPPTASQQAAVDITSSAGSKDFLKNMAARSGSMTCRILRLDGPSFFRNRLETLTYTYRRRRVRAMGGLSHG